MTRLIRVRAYDLKLVRPALETGAALKRLGSAYPSFVHKWTRQKRQYTKAELALPMFIRARGHWPSWKYPVISVGGTRSPTVETFCLVAAVVRKLAAERVLILSGGVPGVDLAAHAAAIDQPDGATVAVLANPVEFGMRGHEWSSASLEAGILERGALISEYETYCNVGSPLYCERLLARDRIISGLSDLFVVFECREDSATVDTARRALAQGKKVVCVNSIRQSERHGVDQLVYEFGVPMFSERTATGEDIAAQILSLVYAAQDATPGAIARTVRRSRA